MGKKGSAGGFTLIEMMVVIAITAILLGIAVPAMRSVIERSAVSDSMNAFIGSVSYARSEAIKRGTPVVMCVSNNADTNTNPTCASGGGTLPGWAKGWIVFADLDGNGARSNGDVVLRVQGALVKNGNILQTPKTPVLTFRPTGLASSGASGFAFSSFSQASSQLRYVCFSFQGRTRIAAEGDICQGPRSE